MPNVEKQRHRLISLLKELFQLDQPDLDFGFYRIMHAKAGQVTKFLEEDLLGLIREAFGKVDEARVAEARAAYEAARKQAMDYGAPDPDATEPVKKARIAWDAVKNSGNNEGDVYDHLYRFFERYYDSGDFMSRRYFARETDGKAAPYAVPYDGREVYLHWANRDQYYIKTSEYLSNFTFDPTQAKEFQAYQGMLLVQKPLKVHCCIVSASEGEHNNVKASEQTERYFIIHEQEPVKIKTGDSGEPELFLQFEYRSDPEKTGQDGAWRKKRLAEATEKVKALLPTLEGADDFVTALMTPAPTEAEKNRTLLEKYLAQYTARNTMDYFIHKDLGGFLRRELDFYIKNEIMRLDDIESADAPRAEVYLTKIKVLRRIAHYLIDFLAQLENFQKKLWLKKKFVVDTQYCITLDRIPEKFYPEIAANEAQREEWVILSGVDKREGYTLPISVEFLKKNKDLILDTAYFPEQWKDIMFSEKYNIDSITNGILLHSENFQALRTIHAKFSGMIKCIYIDPPYNTGQDEFVYKDNYKSSSWLSMIYERIAFSRKLLNEEGSFAVSIDENEISALLYILDDEFQKSNRVGIATVKRGSVTGHKAINKGIVNITEYLPFYAKDKAKWSPNRAFKARDRNERYNNFILNREKDISHWKIVSLMDAFADYKGIKKTNIRKELGNKFEKEIYAFVKNNPDSVVQLAYPDANNVSKDAQEAIKRSKKSRESIILFERPNYPDLYLLGGQRILFYRDRLVEINGELVTAEPLSDIWDDILPNDLHNEGGVSLKKGKKSEKLINRIFEVSCNTGDIVLDYFLGSGTTVAAALKSNLRFIGAEISDYFDTKSLTRVKLLNARRALGSPHSLLVKYVRLESYEDALNNICLRSDADIPPVSNEFSRDYMLRYWLDFETKGSPSLLNIEWFNDPTAYKLKIKKPGTDEYVEKAVDLVETFNWLIGLHVSHLDRWRGYDGDFKREVDPELPQDTNTRLVIDGALKETDDGNWRFRKVEGYILCNPDDHSDREKALIVWRKLTGNLEQDNLMLDEWFRMYRLSNQNTDFDVIYVNGSNNLSNLRQAEETWKVRLIEEAFHQAMWDVED